FATTNPAFFPITTHTDQTTLYTVDETVLPAGSSFVSLQCKETGTANTTVSGDVASIRVEPNETVVCRYTNQAVTFTGCTPGYWRNHPNRWDGSSGATINASGPVDCLGSNANDATTSVKTCRVFNQVFGNGGPLTFAQSGVPNGTTLLQQTGHPGGSRKN